MQKDFAYLPIVNDEYAECSCEGDEYDSSGDRDDEGDWWPEKDQVEESVY